MTLLSQSAKQFPCLDGTGVFVCRIKKEKSTMGDGGKKYSLPIHISSVTKPLVVPIHNGKIKDRVHTPHFCLLK